MDPPPLSAAPHADSDSPSSPAAGSPDTTAANGQLPLPAAAEETRPANNTVALTDDLRRKIIKQVEYYFSDENLKTDKFFMSHVTKDKEGFVPISLIASFKKMKKLAADKSLIAAALKESSLLVLSSSKKKVKRIHPLPLIEVEDPQLCTVLVENLPEDHSTENISNMFCKAGKIKDICIREPNISRAPRNLTIAEKLLSGKLYALVEYETVEEAEKAVATINDERDWRYGIRVKLLKQRAKLQKKVVRKVADYENNTSSKQQEKTSQKAAESENNISLQTTDTAGGEDNDVLSEHHEVTPGGEDVEHLAKEKNGHKGRNKGRARKQKYIGTNGLGHGTASNHVGENSKLPPGLRMSEGTRGFTGEKLKPAPVPRMPDGTRGFTMGRGRPLTSQQN